MEPSRNEVEIKLRVASARDAVGRIEKLGAVLHRPRELEDNHVYDLPSRVLRNAKQLLRLRRKGTAVTLTFKSKAPGEHRHKVYVEHETPVENGDEMHRILTALGYSPWYRYQKYRSLYRLEEIEIAVDETPIGCFVELEGEPGGIDRVAERLGFGTDDYVRSTYHELHEADAAERGVPVGDMVFPELETRERSSSS
jgi:adenylate cyclase class 2